METIKLQVRKWFKGSLPERTKLEIPGWAGDSHDHSDGAKPQPFHCVPFLEAATYGLSLTYPFNTTCYVKNIDGKVTFEGEWDKEPAPDGVTFPPFMTFAPGHYGFTSSLDIKCPKDYIIRIEPHPRFYTDSTGTAPVTVCGHIQGDWWPKVFFVVFRSPRPDETHIFRHNEPYAQILILPKKVSYEITEMTREESIKRSARDEKIKKYSKKIAKNSWSDYLNNGFDDKYKVLASIYAKEGEEGVDRFLESIEKQELDKQTSRRKKMPRKLF